MTPTRVQQLETRLQGLLRLAISERQKGASWLLITPGFAIRLCEDLGISSEVVSANSSERIAAGGRASF
jgi:hypothetical protein